MPQTIISNAILTEETSLLQTIMDKKCWSQDVLYLEVSLYLLLFSYMLIFIIGTARNAAQGRTHWCAIVVGMAKSETPRSIQAIQPHKKVMALA